jgi:parallel beta-helix repeat protein
MKTRTWSCVLLMAAGATLIAGNSQLAAAATLCVNPGKSGCFKTITAAVAAASAGDTIQVAPGTYVEGDIKIGKPSLSLIGANSANTIINAAGKGNGIYIDGLDNPGLSEEVVTGFTIQNANFEGLLVTNASSVTISDNRVVTNDLALVPSVPKCPGQPAFETNEDFDCGEGIHLSGVDHSTVANNLVENNSGGILLSDDTGKTHDNLITGNVVQGNPFDCGITLASHLLYAKLPSTTPRGVDHNTISENNSSGNGLGAPGAGAGVGLFISGPGLETSGNVVIGNRLTGNGLPGVAMHQHTPNPGQNLNDNLIVGNYIAGNAGDSDVPTTVPTGISLLGTSAVSRTLITLNEFARESIDIAINNAGGTVDVHLNSLNGSGIGIDNSGAGAVNAAENWWGCAKGPGANGCTSVTGSNASNVVSTPFLTSPP